MRCIIDGDSGGPAACMDPCPPDTEALENGGETVPDRGKCEEGCGGEEEYEYVMGGADVL